MAWSVFFTALGLLFVFEGIMPFLSPRAWRQIMLQMLAMHDRGLRITGLISMLIGALIVTITASFY